MFEIFFTHMTPMQHVISESVQFFLLSFFVVSMFYSANPKPFFKKFGEIFFHTCVISAIPAAIIAFWYLGLKVN